MEWAESQLFKLIILIEIKYRGEVVEGEIGKDLMNTNQKGYAVSLLFFRNHPPLLIHDAHTDMASNQIISERKTEIKVPNNARWTRFLLFTRCAEKHRLHSQSLRVPTRHPTTRQRKLHLAIMHSPSSSWRKQNIYTTLWHSVSKQYIRAAHGGQILSNIYTSGPGLYIVLCTLVRER